MPNNKKKSFLARLSNSDKIDYTCNYGIVPLHQLFSYICLEGVSNFKETASSFSNINSA